LCGNALYADVMRVQCPRTCGFCTDAGSTAMPPVGPTVCQDLVDFSTGRSDCGDRYSLCRNPIYRTLMTQQCPRTCGYC
uniref:ShKT domain-containing protein n=1 Tax=Heligmosomoides polygyrus TaxID=6339 RepID=A0A183GLI6_HELPZ